MICSVTYQYMHFLPTFELFTAGLSSAAFCTVPRRAAHGRQRGGHARWLAISLRSGAALRGRRALRGVAGIEHTRVAVYADIPACTNAVLPYAIALLRRGMTRGRAAL